MAIFENFDRYTFMLGTNHDISQAFPDIDTRKYADQRFLLGIYDVDKFSVIVPGYVVNALHTTVYNVYKNYQSSSSITCNKFKIICKSINTVDTKAIDLTIIDLNKKKLITPIMTIMMCEDPFSSIVRLKIWLTNHIL